MRPTDPPPLAALGARVRPPAMPRRPASPAGGAGQERARPPTRAVTEPVAPAAPGRAVPFEDDVTLGRAAGGMGLLEAPTTPAAQTDPAPPLPELMSAEQAVLPRAAAPGAEDEEPTLGAPPALAGSPAEPPGPGSLRALSGAMVPAPANRTPPWAIGLGAVMVLIIVALVWVLLSLD